MENLSVKLFLNGKELCELDMGQPRPNEIYHEWNWYRHGNPTILAGIETKVGDFLSPYTISFSIVRARTKEEETGLIEWKRR